MYKPEDFPSWAPKGTHFASPLFGTSILKNCDKEAFIVVNPQLVFRCYESSRKSTPANHSEKNEGEDGISFAKPPHPSLFNCLRISLSLNLPTVLPFYS